MRLLEAIVDANNRAVAGDQTAGLSPSEFAESLPIVVLTCLDPRFNRLFPDALGISKEQFVWPRVAGNIITGPLSAPVQSLAVACSVNGAKEVAIIGHTDCLIGKTSAARLIELMVATGVDRNQLPDNITEVFGLFTSESQNVRKGVDFVRNSPLISPRIPVHGLMVDIVTGKLEWVVNGYRELEMMASSAKQPNPSNASVNGFNSLSPFNMGEMKFPETKIGETATPTKDWLSHEATQSAAIPVGTRPPQAPQSPPLGSNPPLPPRIPVPPPLRSAAKLPPRRP